MRYLVACIKRDRREESYRVYVTDSLYYSGQNKTVSKRYIDLVNAKPVEHRSADDIIDDVVHRVGLKVV